MIHTHVYIPEVGRCLNRAMDNASTKSLEVLVSGSDSDTHCHTLQQTATHYNTLHQTATHAPRPPGSPCLSLGRLFCERYTTLQQSATYCNTLQRVLLDAGNAANWTASSRRQAAFNSFSGVFFLLSFLVGEYPT